MNNEFTSSKSQTDWERLDAMTDTEIDFSDCPELTSEMFTKAIVKNNPPKPQINSKVSVPIDRDILEWFKSQNQDYQTQINRLLREYIEAHP